MATPVNPKALKAIIFDLGGTLLHLSYPFFREAFQRQYQLELQEDDFFKAVSAATDAISRLVEENKNTNDASRLPIFFEHLLHALPIPDDLISDRTTYVHDFILREHHRENLWRYLLPDTLDVLQSLRARYRLAMISNSDGRAEALTIQYGLRPYLEFVIDSHEVGVEKPDPEIFAIALEKLGLPPSACVYVGDVYSIDVKGARSAGMPAILLDRRKSLRDDCIVIRSLLELKALLLEQA